MEPIKFTDKRPAQIVLGDRVNVLSERLADAEAKIRSIELNLETRKLRREELRTEIHDLSEALTVLQEEQE